MDEEIVDPNFLRVVYELRGKVLQTCIELETVMDGYIAEYFCESEDKIIELASIVLAPRIPWGEKLAIFSVLIEKYNRPFMDEYSDFNKDIQNIIEHRNVFAHFPANTTPSGVELFKKVGVVAFLKFKNSKMPVTKEIVYARQPSYTNDEINLILKGIHTYTMAIHKMLKSGEK
jgi:hypothetical protein